MAGRLLSPDNGLRAYSFFGAPLAWAMHLLVSYVLVPVTCNTGQTVWLHLVTLVALAAAFGSIGTSLMLRKRASEEDLLDQEVSLYLVNFSLLMGAIFVLAILLAGVANFLLSACDRSF